MLSSKQDDKEDVERKRCDSVVYIHCRLDTDEAFYVGIGSKKRAYELGAGRRSALWSRFANKYGVYVQIYMENLCREDACAEEIILIKELGRIKDGGRLVNHSDGGEGAGMGNRNAVGHYHKPDKFLKAKLSVSQGRPVINVDTNMIFPNAGIAAKSIGKPSARADISKVCHGSRKTAGGFRWKFA